MSTTSGTISFRSEASLELIKATSNELLGKVDEDKRTFAFRVLLRSFEGFNSGLQQIHFNENYLETDQFPEASFSGKIIEPVDFNKNGKSTIRAKGILKIHGVEQERIIKCDLTIQGNQVHIESTFTVQLSDHNIRIPRVVHEKIATEIIINVKADLSRR
ncbi:MAG: YceI family protein [Bacteroidetes bacterium]|nr:YceI family protein [Bacteroidota bacterium]